MADYTQILTTSAGTVTTVKNLSDAGMTRFTNWAWDAYPQLDADGTRKPKTNGNVADAVSASQESTWMGLKTNVIHQEQKDAAKAAVDGVPELTAS